LSDGRERFDHQSRHVASRVGANIKLSLNDLRRGEHLFRRLSRIDRQPDVADLGEHESTEQTGHLFAVRRII
jgi:hypothetical protein